MLISQLSDLQRPIENAEMSERPKEHDWKSCVRHKRTEGSNPSLCARFKPVADYGDRLFSCASPRTAKTCTLAATALHSPKISLLK